MVQTSTRHGYYNSLQFNVCVAMSGETKERESFSPQLTLGLTREARHVIKVPPKAIDHEELVHLPTSHIDISRRSWICSGCNRDDSGNRARRFGIPSPQNGARSSSAIRSRAQHYSRRDARVAAVHVIRRRREREVKEWAEPLDRSSKASDRISISPSDCLVGSSKLPLPS
jgi:hypothetical protein